MYYNIIIITGVIGYAGNYFYTLAIDSTSDKSVVFGSSENDSVAEKAKSEAEAAFMKHGKIAGLQIKMAIAYMLMKQAKTQINGLSQYMATWDKAEIC